MTSPEDLLGDTLSSRVEQHHLPPTRIGDVVSTAQRIQRRRRLRDAAAGAVVVAVLATPFVVAATRGSDNAVGPTDPSSTDAAPHLRLADIALGAPPAIAWLDGSDYVAADGTRTTLPLDHPSSATPYRGGFLAVVTGPDLGPRVVLLDEDLREVWRRCGQGGFAVSPDGQGTAYTTGACDSQVHTLHLGPTEGTDAPEQTAQLPVGQDIPVGIVGESVVTGSLPGEPSRVVDFDGDPEPITTLGQAIAVSDGLGLVSGQLAGRPRTGAVVEAETGDVRWTAPGWVLEDFSPDGSMVLGVQVDGGSPTGFAVFDADTGERLHEFGQLANLQAQQTVWEDDEHLLSITTQGSDQAILRMTLDGAVERATETAPYVEDSFNVSFAFTPRP